MWHGGGSVTLLLPRLPKLPTWCYSSGLGKLGSIEEIHPELTCALVIQSVHTLIRACFLPNPVGQGGLKVCIKTDLSFQILTQVWYSSILNHIIQRKALVQFLFTLVVYHRALNLFRVPWILSFMRSTWCYRYCIKVIHALTKMIHMRNNKLSEPALNLIPRSYIFDYLDG